MVNVSQAEQLCLLACTLGHAGFCVAATFGKDVHEKQGPLYPRDLAGMQAHYPFFSHQRPFRCCVPITYPPITHLRATAQLPNTNVPCLFGGNALMTAEDTVEDLSR